MSCCITASKCPNGIYKLFNDKLSFYTITNSALKTIANLITKKSSLILKDTLRIIQGSNFIKTYNFCVFEY